MSHTEGGWPAEVDPTDGEQVARWRKKIERDEDYIRTVLHLGSVVEDLVRQNNAIDIYTDYFADVESLTLEPPGISTLTVLRHPLGIRRAVQALAWSTNNHDTITTAFDAEKSDQGHGPCAIFDLARPTAPLTTLSPTSPVLCLAYNLREHNLIGMGQRNGQFALFDVRQSPDPVGFTDPQHSHSDCLTAMAWTQSKTGTEFTTASFDGSVAWWDSRKLSERLETVQLRERGSGVATSSSGSAAAEGPCLAATCLDYSASAGPAKFMVGTSSGAILSGNRKAKSPADRITGSFSGHVSPVAALSRNPFFPKYFLSIGDWTARMWSEDLHVPLVATPCRSHYLTGGAWSQSRPSVFFCTSVDGSLEAWDLLQNHAAPVLTTSLADCGLEGLALQDAGGQGLLAVGCEDGTTLVLRPSVGLTRSQGDEKSEFAAMLERESGRERALEKAGKEAKTRAKREAARASEPVTRVTENELAEVRDFFVVYNIPFIYWLLMCTILTTQTLSDLLL